MDIAEYNRRAWDQLVESGNEWTLSVNSDKIAAARQGDFQIVLTPLKPVPRSWFPEQLAGSRALCLACGGGQQAPILAAAGAEVTVLDNSPKQLQQDREVADREDLSLETVLGDMRDLSQWPEHHFDFVFHPCSISYVPNPQPVFEEVARVLRPGGAYLFGMCNPIIFLFDYQPYLNGEFRVRHSIPYSDESSLTEAEQQVMRDNCEPFCFGHSLETLIGGQLKAGLQLTDFFEDYWGKDSTDNALDPYLPTLIGTRAIRPLE